MTTYFEAMERELDSNKRKTYCKYCKRWSKNPDDKQEYGFCTIPDDNRCYPDDFCCWGVRKEVEG